MGEVNISLIKKNIFCFLILHTIFSARTNEGVKHTTWGVWSQGGNPNH